MGTDLHRNAARCPEKIGPRWRRTASAWPSNNWRARGLVLASDEDEDEDEDDPNSLNAIAASTVSPRSPQVRKTATVDH